MRWVRLTAFLPSASLRAAPDGLTTYALPRFVRPLLDPATTALVEPLLQSVDFISAQINTLDAHLEDLAGKDNPISRFFVHDLASVLL